MKVFEEEGAMKYDSEKDHRRSIRMKGYDYTQVGAYFVTLCTQNRECLLGNIVDGEMRLNDAGRIVADEWARTTKIRREITFDEWVIMPNHLHGIVIIAGNVGAHGRAPLPHTTPHNISASIGFTRQPQSLGSLIAGFKSVVTKRINAVRGTPSMPVWQRNYYEHIIRSEESMNQIRQYILDNPMRWDIDQENPHIIPIGRGARLCALTGGESVRR